MRNGIQNITSLLKRTYTSHAWHGPAVKEVLRDITAEQAGNRFNDSHSIIQLVAHMTAWRIFVVKKLEGDHAYKLTDVTNFPDERDWEKAIRDLEESQHKLLAVLEHFPEDKLQETLSHDGETYTYYVLLHGIIHHDLYHAGQIRLIAKYF